MEQKTTMKTSFFDKKVAVSNIIVLTGISLLFGVGIGASSTPLKNYVNDKMVTVVPSGDLSKKSFSLYWEVYNKLRDYYVDPAKLETNELFYGSIKGMVESLSDAPTAFYTPEETAEYKKAQSGSYSGIGAELDFVNNSVVVVAPFDGSPAQKAGIEPQDVISKVDDKSTANKTLTQVVSEIRGQAGTKVTLTILRPRENFKEHVIEITRGNVSAPSIELKEVKDKVAVVKISRFTESTMSEWVSKWNVVSDNIATQYKNGSVTHLVLDLRNNPGGFFDAAVVLAGDFLPKGSIVAYQRERAGADKVFPTATEPRLADIPVTILVNGSSASASEIFTGAMQYYKRAKVLGEQTYGKGTAQVVLPVSDGASLHVTISKWLLPDKEWLNPENTIEPDTIVKLDYELRAKGIDNQMEEALKLAK